METHTSRVYNVPGSFKFAVIQHSIDARHARALALKTGYPV
jgi:hypothetical protein